MGGLAPNSLLKPQLGRKTFLSKAQKQVVLEVKRSKQSTILGALREKALGGVVK